MSWSVHTDSMKLSELLARPDAVRVPLAANDKTHAIEELVGVLEANHELSSRGDILRRVLERERLMSTGIGLGVAIPHAKSPAVEHVIAACGVRRQGLDFSAADGEPVHLVILVVSPERERSAHVKALAAITRLVQRAEVRSSLIETGDPQAFFDCLQSAEHDAG